MTKTDPWQRRIASQRLRLACEPFSPEFVRAAPRAAESGGLARNLRLRAVAGCALGAFVLVATGCASPAQPEPVDGPRVVSAANADARAAPDAHTRAGDPIPPFSLTPQLMYQLLASEIAAQRGQVGSAAVTYLTLARKTRDPRIARRATELALAERSLEHALPAAQLWHELAPESPIASQTIESLWMATGRFAQAEPLLRERLGRARADRRLPETYDRIARTLARSSDASAGLKMLERLAAPDAGEPAARLALAAVAQGAGDLARAAAEAEAALQLDPANEQAAILAARYVSQSPRGTEGAVALLRSYLEREPKAVEARFALARLLNAGGSHDAAREQFEIALKQEPDSPPILLSLAQLAYQMKQPQVAEDYLRRYLGLPGTVQRDNAPALLFLGQIAEDARRNEEAIDWYAQVGRGEQFLAALTRRAVLMARTGRLDEARALLRGTSVPSARERAQLTAAEAAVLREAGRQKEAWELLSAALERQPESTELLYDHAMAAERLDRLDAMEASLRKLIELRPDYAHAYNALGYSFADRGLRLEEAQGLIAKALELAPDDAQILDSMGWVLFRRGQTEAAIGYLEKAWSRLPEAEIGAHLGEALWRAGRVDEARRIWHEAARDDPENRVLKETVARLRADR
ncbi:MAG: tetratricopeptide repeat protein [Burkholderiaceae bacterium]|nr:tetratricopeptide repeat protein [Burkholderiaceae bacterium]